MDPKGFENLEFVRRGLLVCQDRIAVDIDLKCQSLSRGRYATICADDVVIDQYIAGFVVEHCLLNENTQHVRPALEVLWQGLCDGRVVDMGLHSCFKPCNRRLVELVRALEDLSSCLSPKYVGVRRDEH